VSALAQKSAMRPDAEQSRWDNRVLGDRLVLAHLYSAEPAQRCGRQYAVGRGTSEAHQNPETRPNSSSRGIIIDIITGRQL